MSNLRRPDFSHFREYVKKERGRRDFTILRLLRFILVATAGSQEPLEKLRPQPDLTLYDRVYRWTVLLVGLAAVPIALSMTVGEFLAIGLIYPFDRRSAETTDEHPPRWAEWLLYCVHKRDERLAVTGDLEEDFREACAKFGRRKAEMAYCAQVLRSFGPFIARTLKWALWGWLWDLVRKMV